MCKINIISAVAELVGLLCSCSMYYDCTVLYTVSQNKLYNIAKRCGIMAVLHILHYDVWPWPMTLTKVAKECKN